MSEDMMRSMLSQERDADQLRRDAAAEVMFSIPEIRDRLHEYDADCQKLAERM